MTAVIDYATEADHGMTVVMSRTVTVEPLRAATRPVAQGEITLI